MSSHSIKVSAIRSTVSIAYDDFGIPLIRAKNLDDLFFAQGFVSAKDRFFQMDMSRRAVSGRLSFLMGDKPLKPAPNFVLRDKSIVDLDRIMLSTGIKWAAEKSYEHLTPEEKEYLFCYTNGVNAALKQFKPSFEYYMLRSQRSPWQPMDSLLMIKAMGWELNFAWKTKLFYIGAYQKFPKGNPVLDALTPDYPKDAIQLCCKLKKGKVSKFLNAAELWQSQVGYGGAHIGSNAWAVSPKKSKTGEALLLSDPHLTLTSPPRWYFYKLDLDGVRTYGSVVPGIPGIAIGRNENIATGITNVMADDTDFFVEEIEGKHYRVDGKLRSIDERLELIPQKDGSVLTQKVYFTHRGPLFSRALESDDKLNLPELSMSWSGHAPGSEVKALANLIQIDNFKDFRTTLSGIKANSLNFLYADKKGNIGYVLTGKVPKRKSNCFNFILDGSKSDNDWTEELTADEKPWVYNPKEGFVISANNKICDDSYPYYLSEFWEPPFRFRRIREFLEKNEKVSVRDMMRLQKDHFSMFGLNLCKKVFVEPLKDMDLSGAEKEAYDLLAKWDGNASGFNRTAAIFYPALIRFLKVFLAKHLGKTFASFLLDLSNFGVLAIENLFTTDQWQKLLDGQEELKKIASFCLSDALDWLQEEHDLKKVKWGDLHTVQLCHPFHGVKALRKVVSTEKLLSHGDGTTVSQGLFPWGEKSQPHMVGASQRLLVDFSNENFFYFVLCGGQNGSPFSKNYKDQFQLWAKGEYLQIPWNERDKSICQEIFLHP